jgi:Zn-dependent protease/predicted transcriptional regulator
MTQPDRQVEKPDRAGASPWSFRIATVAGIPVRVHFTFMLFITWIWLMGRVLGGGLLVLFVLLLFLCVILHEFGHALVAQRYGIETKDITIYPIGGVAMLQGRPKPKEELWIALAGPAVNVVIALILGAYLLVTRGHLPWIQLNFLRLSLIEAVFVANVILPLFNMIPAFPMDGGRVLRAALARRMPEARATQIAGSIGQGLAILMGFAGLLTFNILLMLVAFFVFLGAGQEVQAMVGMSLVANRRVKDAMLVRFRTMESGQSIESAAKMLLEGSQQEFPVVYGEEVLGVLVRSDITDALAQAGGGAYVSGHIRREFKRLQPEDPLERALELFSKEDPSPILVMDADDQLVGMVTAQNLSEFIMLEHARQQSRAQAYPR